MLKKYLLRCLIWAILFATPQLYANAGTQILAKVGNLTVTSEQLERAVASSPFATQFVTMNEDDQAALRGDLLRRMVVSRLLYLEAKQIHLEESPAFKEEVKAFRLSLLYRHYMDKLRSRIKIPADELNEMRRQLQGNADALAAAKSSYLADRYRALRMLTIQTLRTKYHVRINEDRLNSSSTEDLPLLEGDGIRITYADIAKLGDPTLTTHPGWIREQLYKRAELLLIAKAADEAGVDVTQQLNAFRKERLPSLLIEQKQAEWVPNDQTLRDYFQKHPEFGVVEERRHIGQLVVGNRDQAEKLRERILSGESLFKLAGQYSIDPYGRAHNGDMGWIKAGRGMPQIEQVLSTMADNQISDIIETPAGFHIVTIIERRPGGKKNFLGVRDRLMQAVISEKMSHYLQRLETRYPVVWSVIEEPSHSSEATKTNGG